MTKAGASPIKVAIVGGGCGAMTAAFELSKPEHAGRYEITIYQEGWRLGGKGASGRGASGRIEEHGLHVWLGFYDNAFRMMRECYAELAAAGASPYGDWRDAFIPESDIGLFSKTGNDGWRKWTAHFPPRPGLPGDPLPAGEGFSLRHYMVQTLSLLQALVLDCTVSEGVGAHRAPEADPSGMVGAGSAAEAMRTLLGRGVFAGAAILAEALAVLRAGLQTLAGHLDAGWVTLAEKVCASLRDWLETTLLANDRHTHVWELVDLALANILGALRFGLLTDPRGLDAIDGYECRDWLRMNGASERAVESAFMRGLYDLALAYEAGDPERPSLSAGQGLRGTLRMFFGYRGAILWRMRAGMGDVVFAPLYDVMRRRGVQFRFFHRLTDVGLPPGGEIRPDAGSHVASLTFDIQAKTRKGEDYEPLIDVAGRPCWPARPRFELLANGSKLEAQGLDFESHWERRKAGTTTLEVGRDFDFVVLGVGLGAVPYVCRQLVQRDARWRRMTQEVKTVASQAFQIWLHEDVQTLGWPGPPFIAAGYIEPFATWCDMAAVVPEEGWRSRPATAIYLCGVLPDPPTPPDDEDSEYPARRKEEVRRDALAYLQGPGRLVWPGAYRSDGQFRWDLLADEDPESAMGPARFAGQYWRANVNPSDRYTLHTPGSSRYRISPLDMTYDNLTIAGDWTDSGFISGCVEGAVMSGLLASHALCGKPALEDILAYDHP
jgi:uncharacterized protein with NAD-binding domain and iron-sulfur cluster